MSIYNALKKTIKNVTLIFSLLLPTSALAEITLQSQSGNYTLVGELVSYENGNYLLKTLFGELLIPDADIICTGEECPVIEVVETGPEKPAITFSGSDIIGDELMPLMLAGYANSIDGILEETTQANGKVIYELISENGFGYTVASFQVDSTAAFKALLENENVIGMSSRRVQREEALSLKQDGGGLVSSIEQEHIIGVDSIAVVVNKENPVSTLSVIQINNIYRGNITNWNQVGGSDMQIVVYSRPVKSEARARFDNRILGASDIVQVARIAGTNAAMAIKIDANPAAIGFVGYAFLRNTKPLNLISECGIISSANTFSAKTEEYLLQRRLYLYNRADSTTDVARHFLDYAISEDADGLVAKAGYIDLGVEQVSQADSQAKILSMLSQTNDPYELTILREMINELVQHDRLSTTFRFASGSNHLERKSQIDLERLIGYLESQPDGTNVTLVGFTDSDGAFTANQNLALRRARQVISAVQDQGQDRVKHIIFTAQGYGELAPATCNTSNDGKRINRRVEVWMRN